MMKFLQSSDSVGLYIMDVKNYGQLEVITMNGVERSYLLFISGSGTRRNYPILNATSSQMIQDSVVGQEEDTSIILHWSDPIKDALVQKHRKRWGTGKSICKRRRSSIFFRMFRGIGVL